MSGDPPRLPPGRPPWDTLNGFRVGVLAGGILGAVTTLATGWRALWLVIVGAALGGTIGYWVERRKRYVTSDDDAADGG